MKERENGFVAMLGKLSASAILGIGAIYVMGYVIVNGYQAKYMDYSANALQLKHLAAGLLYSFLTLFQVCLVAFFLMSGVIDVKFPAAAAEKKELEKDGEIEDQEKGKTAERKRTAWDVTKSVGNYFSAIGKSFVLAYFLIVLFFQFVGMTLPPTTGGFVAVLGGSLVILKGILPWVVINLLMSIIIVKGLYTAGSKNFDSAFSQAYGLQEKRPSEAQPEQTSSETGPEPASGEEKRLANFEVQQLRRMFIEAQSKPLVAILSSFVLLSLSLVFFQGLYGRLKPDYGGGALYRVAIHLKTSQVSSPTAIPSPTPMPLANSTPSAIGTTSIDDRSDDWKEALKKNNSWLLLVDRDASFLYVLRVDKEGGKQLLQISTGEIEAVEVLAHPPISPADARFFIQ